jgi:hypothetical protein
VLATLVAAAAIQQAHAVLVQVVQRVPQQIVLQQVVHTTVMAQPVLATHVVAVVVKLVGVKIAKVLASQTMCMKAGLATATATMVHIFLPTMVVKSAQLA